MTNLCQDLTIEGALTDPMVRALMKADGVDPRAFEALLRSSARNLRADRPSTPFLAGVVGGVRRTACGATSTW